MKNLLIFWLMLGMAYQTLQAQQFAGQGTMEINFLEGSHVVHSLRTDQLVVQYDADQQVLRFMVKPGAFAVGASPFDQSVVEDVLQSPANRLMMIQAMGLALPTTGTDPQSLSSSFRVGYQSRNLELPGVLALTPASDGFHLKAELVTSLDALGLYLPAAFQDELSTDLQLNLTGLNLTER